MSKDTAIDAALFNFCSHLDDGPEQNRPPLPPRDPEDLKWLREALESVESPERRIKKILSDVLETAVSGGAEPERALVEALEELSDMVEDINWATEFLLMKGPAIVIDKLRSDEAKKSDDVRRLLAMVIAHAAQQNAKVQEEFNALNWAEVLLPMIRVEQSKPVLAALLHACSCMCRDSVPSSAEFLNAGGLELLQSILSPQESHRINDRIAQRVLFLVEYFAHIGVSSVQLAERTAQLVSSSSEAVGIAAAKAAIALFKKNPAAVTPIIQGPIASIPRGALAGAEAGDARVILRDLLSSSPTNATETQNDLRSPAQQRPLPQLLL
jgi:predicted protein tyrosine phosphatase